ncbi:hypothetical protein [Hazenella coriacea]|uniref:Uncharacterized protein n=1 Tax=Hazenella coriacea TaxID=1179467 RepID=A0A4R3L7L5_9BACL|nr:hypothetical protein [Hazenella coriacea]TCS93486.1 hypothetical protein EDD58_107134 [Hazenella coriacea]
MRCIRFWFDSWEQVMILLHLETNKKKVLRNPKEIQRFLCAYELDLHQCKGVLEAEDRLHYFGNRSIRQR